MHKHCLAIVIMLPLAACQTPGQPFATNSSVAEAQAELTTDPAQAALWRQAAENSAATGIREVPVPADAVASPATVTIADRPAAMARVPFPATMESGIVIVDVPEQVGKYSGAARVTAIEGEFLTLDLGGKGELVLQAKVRGGPLRATVGDKGQVVFRQGDPFRRDDLLTVKLPNDALLYAIIGGSKPVRISAKAFDLSARQLAPSEVKGDANVEQSNQTDLRLSLQGENSCSEPWRTGCLQLRQNDHQIAGKSGN